MNLLSLTTADPVDDICMDWSTDALVVGEIELDDETYTVYRCDDKIDWECGVDQGFITNGASPDDVEEVGLKVWKRGFPLTPDPDLKWYQGYWKEECTQDWCKAQLEDSIRNTHQIYERQEHAAQHGLGPDVGRMVVVIAPRTCFKVNRSKPVRARPDCKIIRMADGTERELNPHFNTDCMAPENTWVAQKIVWEYEEVPTTVWVAYIGFETQVADTSFAHDFPVQDEDDPYGCYNEIATEYGRCADIISSSFEDADLGDDPTDEAIDKVWEKARDEFMSQSFLQSSAADECIWDYITETFTIEECASVTDCDLDWDLYEIAGQCELEYCTDYCEASDLTNELLALGYGGDLHTGNVGWLNNRWVCIDFSEHCVR